MRGCIVASLTPTPTTPPLPILLRKEEIVAAIRSHQVVVICGETGSGKTTQLPQICFDMGLAHTGMIGHTQPRRLAARAVAARIAEERAVRLGGLVGVKVRFQDTTSRETRIKLVTDGMLLAEMSGGDPELRAYSTIIIDEAHERSLNVDLLLGYLRGLIKKRPDLKVIVTSATIDPGRFSDYFGGRAVAPVIEVSGRGYPVDVRYRPYRDDEDEPERVEVEHVADAVEELLSPRLEAGDVLVFLPGEREIRMAGDALRRRSVDAEVLPLFSRLTNQEQDRIFHPLGRRRVILSTNVAETSLTVPGIRYVVDTGLARLSRYDPARKIQRLPIEPVSRASANQRAGRCGRLGPGVCIRLYSEESYASRPAFTDPEIRRTSLASVILQMKSLRVGSIEDFAFLDKPDVPAIKDGYETLFELGAIDAPGREGHLTPIGERVSRIPLDPRIARMLLGAEREGALRETVVLAAVLSIQDPRERPMSRQADADRAHAVFKDESSDFLTLLKLWDQSRHAGDTMASGAFLSWCREHFVSAARLREWLEMVRQIGDVAEDLKLSLNGVPAKPDAIHRSLLTGLISNVACREGDGSFDYRGVRGNVVQIFPGSALFKKGPKWIMAAEVVQTTRLYARTVARVTPEWMEELAGHMFRRQLSDPHLDAETGTPSAWERLTMSGIVVVPRRRADLAPFDPAAARQLFIHEGLAACKWKTDAPFMVANRETLSRAAEVEARLRRKNVLRPADDLARWFEARIPAVIREPVAFEAWRAEAERTDPRVLVLGLTDVVKPEAAPALDAGAFPSEFALEGNGTGMARVTYALSPGKDEDGVTVTVGLRDLPRLTDKRAAWLVPGLLAEVVAGLIKTLPKATRAAVEAKGDAPSIARECAQAMAFAAGSLAVALSEALDVLHGVHVDPGAWSLGALPSHLRMRVRVVDVVDGTEKEIGADRDLASLRKRFEGRLRQAREADSREDFDRRGLTGWTFGDLPGPGATGDSGVPTLVDAGASVSLTLAPSAELAEIQTRLGVRRLLVLACADEVKYYLEAFPAWGEMTRQYGQLGSPEELRDQVTLIIADRVFLFEQGALRTRAAFEERTAVCWGRLSAASREVCEAVARVLEARAQVARRFSGGTPRLWAASVADMREQAAYLMPRGFIAAVGWERLRRYPVYAEVMRERLLTLREEGSQTESAALAAIAPHWKRFTGWVAGAMAAERVAQEQSGDATAANAKPDPRRTKAPLPQARRAAPNVNLDAGEWAARPGNVPKSVDRYRWYLEEFRVALLDPSKATRPPPTAPELTRLARSLPEPGA